MYLAELKHHIFHETETFCCISCYNSCLNYVQIPLTFDIHLHLVALSQITTPLNVNQFVLITNDTMHSSDPTWFQVH